MNKRYELHIYSNKDGLNGVVPIRSIFCRLNEKELAGIALTNHDSIGKEILNCNFDDNKKRIIGSTISIQNNYSGYEAVILVKDIKGYENLIKLLELASENDVNILNFPDIDKYREGLLIGCSCNSFVGENCQDDKKTGILEQKMIEKMGNFFDYYEVAPPEYNSTYPFDGSWTKELIYSIIGYAEKMNKPVVAVSAAGYSNCYEEMALRILNYIHYSYDSNSDELIDYKQKNKAYLYSTSEMLDIFSFLGEDLAKKIVFDNTENIADQIIMDLETLSNLRNIKYEKINTDNEYVLGEEKARKLVQTFIFKNKITLDSVMIEKCVSILSECRTSDYVREYLIKRNVI